MLSQYPIIFDNTTIPFYPSAYDRSDDKVSVINQTEDGHDDVELIRAEKTSLSLTFNVNSHWAKILKEYRRKSSISVKIYDLELGGYATKTMRMEDYSESLLQHSEKTHGSMGLYTISFTLEEF